MPVMGTRLKRVAEVKDWHFSYAEIAAIVGHEIAAELSGMKSDIEWMNMAPDIDDVPEEAKKDVMLSLLAAKQWKMWYEDDITVFDFDSLGYPAGLAAVYDYRIMVIPNGGKATLFIDSHRFSPHVLHAKMTLDEDYFDFLGTMRYEGSDKEWSEVEE